MALSRDQKVAVAAFAGGVLVGFLASRVRISGQLQGVKLEEAAKLAALGYMRGRKLNEIDFAGAALRGIMREIEGTP